MTLPEILGTLKKQYNKKNLEGMARFGINTETAYGIPVEYIRTLAKKIGKDHDLAQELWKTGLHDARMLAILVDDPRRIAPGQMDKWVRNFDSWDICDGCCIHLFRKTPHAYMKIPVWAASDKEYIKRAAFALLATVALHDKDIPSTVFLQYLYLIEEAATDDRNYVKKAVNWALRQIGKRNLFLHKEAIACAERLSATDSKSARWIARDALQELRNEKIIARIAEEN